MKIYLLLLTLLGFTSIYNASHTKEEATMYYIDKFAPLAVEEMNRSGIPASIILAQGIHESNSGKSQLALEANNHFGIKCKTYWKGSTFYYKDDDFNEKGELIRSCFRAYRKATESYRDHTEFLMNTSYYKSLFAYSKHDYVEWAKGLKQCGYATDPAYAEKLIRLVNMYDLSRFDKLNTWSETKSGTVLETMEVKSVNLPQNYQRKRYMDK